MDERKDFTIDPVNFAGLAEYVRELQAGGMHFISILVGNKVRWLQFAILDHPQKEQKWS